MIKVLFPRKKGDNVYLNDVSEHVPIFVKKDGKLIGMVVKEDKGWIVRIGGSLGMSGYHPSRSTCMEAAYRFDNFEFFVEDNFDTVK